MTTTISPVEIVKPSVDDRLYRHVTLSNGIGVILVQDDTADKASAAVDVHVGQFQDPLEGLAHLVEHMLFMGTKKFPKENELDSFLSANGGMSNAYTDLEHTVYYMDVSTDAFRGALERFASVFVEPLLGESSVGREIEAVHSEHSKNKQSDHWRYHQLTKNLLGTENHVYGLFGTGNMDTLQPKGPAVLRKAVAEFFERYYKANRMKVCLVGHFQLDELQAMAEECFGSVPNAPVAMDPIPPLTPELPRYVQVIPTRETPILELQWPCRELKSLYKSKPTNVISHLLGHEGPGSLLFCLRERHWAQELYADSSSKSTSIFSVFTMQLELTESGCDHVNDIVEMIFAFIDILKKGIPEWVVDELQVTSQMQFRFLSKQSPADTASRLSSNLHLYDVSDVLSGAYLSSQVDLESVNEYLASLRPDNVLILHAQKGLSTEKTAPHYGTQYSILDLPVEVISRWKAPNAVPDLRLPDENDMLATDFELKEKDAATTKPHPVCLMDSDTCRLWYKPDTVFRMPKVNIMLLLHSPIVYESPIQSVLASLWAETAQELCNSFAYAASVAGLYCDFSNTRHGIEMHVSGYNDKAHVLLSRMVETVKEFNVGDALFDRIQSKVKQQFQAFLVAQPYQHTMNGADRCMEVPKWDIFDRIECLDQISCNDLLHFGRRQVLTRFRMEMLVHGNVTPDEARTIAARVTDQWKPLSPLSSTQGRVVNLPNETIYGYTGWNPEDENSAVANIYQIGVLDTQTNATLALLHHLIREPAFGQLRTKEQLGYIVHSQVKTNGQCKSLLVLIQSDSHPADYLDQRIESFWLDFRKILVNMPEETFKTNVHALRMSFLEKPKNLGEESSRYWGVIANQTYQFSRWQDLADALIEVTKLQVLRMYDRYILADSPHRRKLSVQGYGKDRQQPEAMGAIESPLRFSHSRPLLPNREPIDISKYMVVQ